MGNTKETAMSNPTSTDQSFEGKYHELKLLTGVDEVKTKDDAALIFNAIKNGRVDVNSLSKESQNTLKKFLDENGGNLDLPKGIDWSQYGIDTKAAENRREQEKLASEQKKKLEEQKQMSLVQEKNNFNYQTNYHFDNTILLGIGMVCITILIIVVLILFKRKLK